MWAGTRHDLVSKCLTKQVSADLIPESPPPTPEKMGKKSIKQFQENLADTLETRMNIKHPLVNQTVVC